METQRPLIIGYFYPHSSDPDRNKRAEKLGYPQPESDIWLAANSNSLFHPRAYCINKEGKTNLWNDSDPAAIKSQLDFFQQIGITTLAIDAYAGIYQGKPYHELKKPLNVISQEIKNTGLNFFTVMCLKLPRAILPINPDMIEEPYRDFELSFETLNEMIYYSSQYWSNPNYLKINDRPVVALYGLTALKVKNFRTQSNYIQSIELRTAFQNSFGAWMKTEGKKYDNYKEPFLIGVVNTPLMAPVLDQLGFDLITTMCGLPDFPRGDNLPKSKIEKDLADTQTPVEKYMDLLDRRENEWHTIKNILLESLFIPSLTLGWNPGPRIKPKDASYFKTKKGFPYSPIICDPKPEEIKIAFEYITYYLASIAQLLIKNSIPPMILIYALQEIGESACLLNQVMSGEINTDLSNAVKNEILKLKKPL